jgi:hypothetical protein
LITMMMWAVKYVYLILIYVFFLIFKGVVRDECYLLLI